MQPLHLFNKVVIIIKNYIFNKRDGGKKKISAKIQINRRVLQKALQLLLYKTFPHPKRKLPFSLLYRKSNFFMPF